MRLELALRVLKSLLQFGQFCGLRLLSDLLQAMVLLEQSLLLCLYLFNLALEFLELAFNRRHQVILIVVVQLL